MGLWLSPVLLSLLVNLNLKPWKSVPLLFLTTVHSANPNVSGVGTPLFKALVNRSANDSTVKSVGSFIPKSTIWTSDCVSFVFVVGLNLTPKYI